MSHSSIPPLCTSNIYKLLYYIYNTHAYFLRYYVLQGYLDPFFRGIEIFISGNIQGFLYLNSVFQLNLIFHKFFDSFIFSNVSMFYLHLRDILAGYKMIGSHSFSF